MFHETRENLHRPRDRAVRGYVELIVCELRAAMGMMAPDSREMKGRLTTIKIEGYILEIYIFEVCGIGDQIVSTEVGW